MSHRPANTYERIAARVDTSAGPEGCWLFRGCHDTHGRPRARFALSQADVARVLLGRVVPPARGQELNRHCATRACCNPAHFTWRNGPVNVPTNAGKQYAKFRPGGATLDEVATALGVTPEGARQIELAALAKLRKGMRRSGVAFAELLSALEDGRFAAVFGEAMK